MSEADKSFIENGLIRFSQVVYQIDLIRHAKAFYRLSRSLTWRFIISG